VKIGLESKRHGIVLLAIVFIGLVLRLAAIVWFTPPMFSDDIEYVALGRSLANGEGYLLDGQPTAHRPPGYPLFLAASFKIFGDSFVPVRIAQVLAGMISCVLVFVLARKFFSERVGLFAAGICAVFPEHVLYVSFLMTETLFAALLLLFLWLCADEVISWKRGILAGIVLGIGTLVRPTMLLLPALVFIVRWCCGGSPRRHFKSLAIIGVSGFVVLLPWLIRNYEQFGRITITSNIGMNFWMGNHSGASGSYSFPHGNPIWAIANEFDQSDAGVRLGIEFIRDHPLEYGMTLAKKWAHFFSVDYWLLLAMQYQPDFKSAPNPGVVYSKFSMASVLAIHLPFAAVLLLATFGFVCHAPQDVRKVLFLLSPCVYWLMVHLVFFGDARFRFPIVSILMIIAAYGVDLILRKEYVWTRTRAVVVSFLVMLFIGGWTAERILIHRKAEGYSDAIMVHCGAVASARDC
jgi:4-amino-4-deoxy-L-arabinose transferase-like glycosyltransferase